jgi:hypothetical protein
MTDIAFDHDRDLERPKGIYPACTFVSVEPITIKDKVSGEDKTVWRWLFIDEHDAELDTITGTSFRPRTNALKLLTSLLGRVPQDGDKPADVYGKDYDVVWGENQGGKLTITDLMPTKAKK